MDREDTAFERYSKFVETFGNDEALHLIFKSREIFEEKNMQRYARAIQALEGYTAVETVLDPVSQYFNQFHAEQSDEDRIAKLRDSKFRTFLKDLAESRAFSEILISPDGEFSGLILILKDLPRDEKLRFLSQLRDDFDDLDFFYKITGPLYFSEALASGLRRDLGVMVPNLFLLAAVLLFFILRNIPLILCILTAILLSLACTLSLFPVTGVKLSLASLILFPLIFCVGMTTAVHLFSRVSKQKKVSEVGFWDGFRDVFPPAGMAALTTALGTSAFIFAPQQAVQMIGVAAPLGIALVFVFVFFFVPCMYKVLTGSLVFNIPKSFHIKGILFSSKSVNLVIVLIFLSAALVASAGMKQLKINSDAMFFFKKDSRLIQDYRYFEEHLTGTMVLEILLEATDGTPMTEGIHLEVLHAFQKKIQTMKGVTKTSSILDSLDEVLQRMGNP